MPRIRLAVLTLEQTILIKLFSLYLSGMSIMTCSWTHLKPKKWSSVAQIRLPYPFSLNSSWSNPTRHYCTFKLLGLHLDASLSWTTHINTVRCIQSQQKTVLPQTTEESRRPTPTTPTTPLLHYSNPPSSRVCLPSLALLHHSRAILPTGINPKTSSTCHLQWHPWHVISQHLICCQLKFT